MSVDDLVPDLDPDVPVVPAPLPALLVLVAVGGALGALARYGLSTALPAVPAIWGINVLGSFLLGVLVARRPDGRWSRPFLGTGVLGGFTTMSTLAVDTLEQPPVTAMVNLLATLVAGIGAAALGMRCRL